jgi:nucleoside-diphosphate-sugar epimerase
MTQKIFVAGATGAIGRHLVPMLLANGHEVVATTTSPEKAGPLRAIGAEPAVVDLLDRDAVVRAIVRSEPHTVVHQATALSGAFDMKHFSRTFEQTNRLRTRGTDHLLEGARAARARRFVAQGFAGWSYGSGGGSLKTEDDPLDPTVPAEMRSTVDAMLYLENVVLGADDLEGIVLRYGGFYGPETSLGAGGDIVEAVRKRQVPIVGDGAGVWSFIHVEDAASATVAAIEGGAGGVYNVVDDEPSPVTVWLPELAALLGAKPPRKVPAWVAKLLIGETGVWLMTRIDGASNAKARATLGWTLRYPTWRVGFREGLGERFAESA